MSSALPNAGWPADVLLTRLARVHWGPLEGHQFQGCRSVLRAIVDLTGKSGQGHITAWEIHRSAGLSERWTRFLLQWLEDLGVVEWRRGGVESGRPRPGWIKLSKRWLADTIRAFMPTADLRFLAHARATAARIAALGGAPNFKNRNRKTHAELSADPLSHREEKVRRAPHQRSAHASSPSSKKDPHMKTQPLDREFLPHVCFHEQAHPIYCPKCRSIARRAQDEASQANRKQEQLRLGGSVEPSPAEEPLTSGQLEYMQYMQATYPDQRPSQWWRTTKTDPRARELLANAS